VEERLAACVHVVSGITAFYRWEGRIEEDAQTLLLVKTVRSAWPAMAGRVKELHSDEVPEIIAVPIAEGLSSYLRWIDTVVDGS
jgi:periplasmic divalent cation tolerance protein